MFVCTNSIIVHVDVCVNMQFGSMTLLTRFVEKLCHAKTVASVQWSWLHCVTSGCVCRCIPPDVTDDGADEETCDASVERDAQSVEQCGLLTSQHGPFAACHGRVSSCHRVILYWSYDFVCLTCAHVRKHHAHVIMYACMTDHANWFSRQFSLVGNLNQSYE